MPRILEMKEVDGKLAVFLDMPTDDEGSVTLWTNAERLAALKAERDACAEIAEEYDDEQTFVEQAECLSAAEAIALRIRTREIT
jgi:hypothetical protein